jgi:hypothetical protein
VLNISAPKPPRVRVMIGLTLFGLIHLLVHGLSLRRCWHHVMSSTDPKMRTALLGGST